MSARWRCHVLPCVAAVALAVLAHPGISAAAQDPAASLDTRTRHAAVSSYVRLVDGGAVAARREGVPANIYVAPGLAELLRRMWQQSPTFRRQCARIAAASHLIVRIQWRSPMVAGACAKTSLRHDAERLEADVRLAARRGASSCSRTRSST
jgi:hypothetical protein